MLPYYHISEGLHEDPTMTLSQISIVVKDLQITVKNLKLEISIDRFNVNNVPWNDIKSLLAFTNSTTKLILCSGLIEYPPEDLRSTIIGEMHCSPTDGHRGITKTY